MKPAVIVNHAILIAGALLMVGPIVVVFLSSTHSATTIASDGLQFTWGDGFWDTYVGVLTDRTGFTETISAGRMLINSTILGLGFSIGKIVIAMIAAYALVYFRIPFGTLIFWLIFSTLLLPLEVRIIPSYAVVAGMGMLNSYIGLIVPLIASATGTFFFRQFFKSVPDELLEAARIDGAGPFRFFIDVLLPLSRTMIAAIFIIMFVYGWNQYLWPLLMTTEERYYTIVMGIKQSLGGLEVGGIIPDYNKSFALSILAMLPPVLIVVFFQRWFVRGLVETEK
ncbi:MAG: sn-glycerol-3-phosphate ABC transporter permease UgpE [Inquilinaceae bacterium]